MENILKSVAIGAGLGLGLAGVAWFIAKKIENSNDDELINFGVECIGKTGKIGLDLMSHTKEEKELAKFGKYVIDVAKDSSKYIFDRF